MYGYEELASYTSGDVRFNDSLLGLRFYETKNTDKVILAHEARINTLEEANQKLRCDNITMSLKYNEVLNDLNDENEKLKGENAKLKCLTLHLFKHLAYHECDDWNYIGDGLAESKLKKRCVRNADRWWRIAKRCNEAYRKAKKALREGK